MTEAKQGQEEQKPRQLDLNRVELGKFSGFLPGGYLRPTVDMPDDETNSVRQRVKQICQDVDRVIEEKGIDMDLANWLLKNHLAEQEKMIFCAQHDTRELVKYHYERSHAYNIVFEDIIRPIFLGMVDLGYDPNELI